MDEEAKRDVDRLQVMNERYLTGRKNKGGSAYNIISLDYDPSPEGSYLMQRDNDAKVRALMRSKNIDSRSNCGYNPLNGSVRHSVSVPFHPNYNPVEPNRQLQGAGQQIMGAGAPSGHMRNLSANSGQSQG